MAFREMSFTRPSRAERQSGPGKVGGTRGKKRGAHVNWRRLRIRGLNIRAESKRIAATSAPEACHSRIHGRWKRSYAGLLMALWMVSAAWPQEKPNDLSSKSIEDLMNIEVTSASKKEQKISQVAAAIFVVTQEDIRNSGANNVPDLLRMVPGLDVAQINASNWAISARGLNSEFANELLVLVDGRSVYTPLTGGVYWNAQDFVLEDIDRIEVICGPGAAIWGANAVNGVINIITKRAQDTPGALVTVGGGSSDRNITEDRYGASSGKLHYRIFTTEREENSSAEPPGNSALDGWNLVHGGFRTDTDLSSRDKLTVQGDLYEA